MSQPRSYYPSRVSYEFRDFPVDDLPVIPHDWKDMSWHNDTCPCFETDDGFFIFIDYADTAMREDPESCRYLLTSGEDENIFAFTDHWPTLVERLSDVRKSIALNGPYEA